MVTLGHGPNRIGSGGEADDVFPLPAADLPAKVGIGECREGGLGMGAEGVNLRIVYALFCVSVRVHCSGRKCQSFHQLLKKVCDRIYFLKDFCLFNASEKNAYTKN